MLIMAKACQRENPTVAPIDCVIYIMEWVTDWNNQFNLYDKIEAHKAGWYREFVDNITERIS